MLSFTTNLPTLTSRPLHAYSCIASITYMTHTGKLQDTDAGLVLHSVQ